MNEEDTELVKAVAEDTEGAKALIREIVGKKAWKPRIKPWPKRFVFAYGLARVGFDRGRLHSLYSAYVAVRPWWLSKRGRKARKAA